MTTSELIARLERKLAVARRVPTHRREAECADVIEDTCRAMLDDLYSGRDRNAHGRWPRRPESGLGGQRFFGEFHAIATGLLGGVQERICPRQQSVNR